MQREFDIFFAHSIVACGMFRVFFCFAFVFVLFFGLVAIGDDFATRLNIFYNINIFLNAFFGSISNDKFLNKIVLWYLIKNNIYGYSVFYIILIIF